MSSPPLAAPLAKIAQVKGTVVSSRIRFLRHYGPEAVKAVFDLLPAGDRHVLQGIVLAVTWYPAAMIERLDYATAQVLSPARPEEVFIEIGAASAQANLQEHQSSFLKRGDPHYVLSRIGQLHPMYQDQGSARYEKTGDNRATVVIDNVDVVWPTICLSFSGWLQQAIIMSGAKGVTVAHPSCRSRGAQFCSHLCQWQSVEAPA